MLTKDRPSSISEPRTSESGSLKARYVSAAFYSGLGGGLNQMLYGLTPIIVARYLGPHNYGIYSLIMSLTGMVVAIFSLGQNSALHKLLPEYSVRDPRAGGAILANVLLFTSVALIVVCAVFFGVSEQVAVHVYRDRSLNGIFQVCAPMMLLLALFNLAGSAVAGMQDFKAYHQILLARNLALIAAAWLGVRLWGLPGAVGAQLLAGLGGLICMVIRTRQLAAERFPATESPIFSRRILKIVFSFVLPTLLVTMLNIPVYWWANTMVARTAGFEQAGLFGAAYTIAQWITIVPISLYPVIMTYTSEAQSAATAEFFSGLVSGNLRLVWSLTLPIAVVCAILAPISLRLLYGPAYAGAGPLVFVLSFTAVLMVVIGLINTVIAASGRMWHGLGITLGWALILVLACLFMIPRWGAAGSSIAFAVSHLVYLAGGCLYLRWAMLVECAGAGRLLVLTLLGFAAALPCTLADSALATSLLGGLLLLAIVAAEWRWVYGTEERLAFRRLAANFLER
ncbi:MAG TPA: oligosaccharide flippase family protein [Blastocatellia bacterium]|nr:oligosaccharide flippase family protein [Blastocatellia bacterium]